jgi:hypothetical protein
MERHVREKRCRGKAWFRGVEQTMLLDASNARLLEECGGGDLLDFEHMEAYRSTDARRPHLPLVVQYGAVLRSPIEGITARVWWYVVKTTLLVDDDPKRVVERALTPDGFAELTPNDLWARVVTCPHCDDLVINLSQHQQSNRRCRMARAANRVVELWSDGYRDPWTVPGGAPLTWSELKASRWRKRLVVVEFPKWNAVVVSATNKNERSASCDAA